MEFKLANMLKKLWPKKSRWRKLKLGEEIKIGDRYIQWGCNKELFVTQFVLDTYGNKFTSNMVTIQRYVLDESEE